MDNHGRSPEDQPDNSSPRQRSQSCPPRESSKFEMNTKSMTTELPQQHPNVCINTKIPQVSPKVPIAAELLPRSLAISNRHKKFLADFEKLNKDAPMALKSKPKGMLNRDWARRLSAGTFAIDGLLHRNSYCDEAKGPSDTQIVTFLMAANLHGNGNTSTTGTTGTSGQLTDDSLNHTALSTTSDAEPEIQTPTTPFRDVQEPHNLPGAYLGDQNDIAEMSYHYSSHSYQGPPHQGNNGNQQSGGQFYNPQGMEPVRWGPPIQRQVYTGFQVNGQSVDQPVFGPRQPQQPQQLTVTPSQAAQYHSMANNAQQQYMNNYSRSQQDRFTAPHHPPIDQASQLTDATNKVPAAYQILQRGDPGEEEHKLEDFQIDPPQASEQVRQVPRLIISTPHDEDGFEPLGEIPPLSPMYAPPRPFGEHELPQSDRVEPPSPMYAPPRPFEEDEVLHMDHPETPPPPPREDFKGIWNPLMKAWMCTDFNIKKLVGNRAEDKCSGLFNEKGKSILAQDFGVESPKPRKYPVDLGLCEKYWKPSKSRFYQDYPGDYPRDPIWGTASGFAPPAANWNERKTNAKTTPFIQIALRNAEEKRKKDAKNAEVTRGVPDVMTSKNLDDEYEQLFGRNGINPFELGSSFTYEDADKDFVAGFFFNRQLQRDILNIHGNEYDDDSNSIIDNTVVYDKPTNYGYFTFGRNINSNSKSKPNLKVTTSFLPNGKTYTPTQAAEDARLAQTAADRVKNEVDAANRRGQAVFMMGFGVKTAFRTISRIRFDTFGKLDEILAERHKCDVDKWCEYPARQPRMLSPERTEEGQRFTKELRNLKNPMKGLYQNGCWGFAQARG